MPLKPEDASEEAKSKELLNLGRCEGEVPAEYRAPLTITSTPDSGGPHNEIPLSLKQLILSGPNLEGVELHRQRSGRIETPGPV